jgi:class 3 adenylate cyclase
MRKLDTILIVTLTGAWCVCLLFHVNQLVRGGFAWIPIYVDAAPAPDAYPSVRSFWPGTESQMPGLAPGDRLESIDGRDLAGAGRLDVVQAFYASPRSQRVDVVALRADQRHALTVQLQAIPHAWRKTLVALGFGLLGTLAFWRMRGSRVGRAFYLAMMAYAFHWTDFWGGSDVVTSASLVVFGVATGFTAPLALRAFQVFPEESAPPEGTSRWWPWLFLAMGPVFSGWAFGLPFPLPLAGALAVALNAAYVVTLIVVLTLDYRSCGPRGRRQLKWVVLGFWIGLVPIFITSLLSLAAPELWWLYEASLVLSVAIPICLFIALVRFDLFDINRLLTTAATYSVVGTVVLASVLLVVPRASAAAADWIEPQVSEPVLAIALAGCALVGLRQLDRLLYDRLHPERRALEAEAGRMRRDLSGCEKPADLLTLLGNRLRTLLQLECVAIYSVSDSVFAPVFVRGAGVSPSFDATGSLASQLEASQAPLDPNRRGERVLDPTERAALGSMGVELVLPILMSGELPAFVCLGGKGSGDVFTASDVALLQGLADKAADELLRFEQDEIDRESRELHQELRRFVPGAVARELEEGFQLVPGEREVSVLFVDIRGYTPFSEGQRPDAIFAAISQYTDLVSRVVEEHGGSVVEFHGDGLMAVFGAPRPHDEKEVGAVLAARKVVASMSELDVRLADGTPHRLDVGLGIATGPAYVGPLKTADRVIWSALGNTTNLAARLEGATRDLEAAIVIDAATRAAAGAIAADFEPWPGLQLKGRSAPIDVFTWSRDIREIPS